MNNLFLVQALREISERYRVSGNPGDVGRAGAYLRASNALAEYQGIIDSGETAQKNINGVGKGISAVIEQLITTGRCEVLDRLRATVVIPHSPSNPVVQGTSRNGRITSPTRGNKSGSVQTGSSVGILPTSSHSIQIIPNPLAGTPIPKPTSPNRGSAGSSISYGGILPKATSPNRGSAGSPISYGGILPKATSPNRGSAGSPISYGGILPNPLAGTPIPKPASPSYGGIFPNQSVRTAIPTGSVYLPSTSQTNSSSGVIKSPSRATPTILPANIPTSLSKPVGMGGSQNNGVTPAYGSKIQPLPYQPINTVANITPVSVLPTSTVGKPRGVTPNGLGSPNPHHSGSGNVPVFGSIGSTKSSSRILSPRR